MDMRASAGSHMELLPVLQRPADFDEALDAFGVARKEGAMPSSSAAAPSPLDALTTLNTQCTVFKRSAQDLGESLRESSCG